MVVRIRCPVELELTVFAGKMQHAPSSIELIARAVLGIASVTRWLRAAVTSI